MRKGLTLVAGGLAAFLFGWVVLMMAQAGWHLLLVMGFFFITASAACELLWRNDQMPTCRELKVALWHGAGLALTGMLFVFVLSALGVWGVLPMWTAGVVMCTTLYGGPLLSLVGLIMAFWHTAENAGEDFPRPRERTRQDV